MKKVKNKKRKVKSKKKLSATEQYALDSKKIVVCGCCGVKHRSCVWVMYPGYAYKFPICEECRYRFTYNYSCDLSRQRKKSGKRIGLKKVSESERP